MGFEPEVENVPVPGQGLRRVRNLPLVSAIGFSGEVKNGLLVDSRDEMAYYPLGSSIVAFPLRGGQKSFLTGHTYLIGTIAISNSGKYLASGETDNVGTKVQVIIWDTRSKSNVGSHLLHHASVAAIGISPNDRFVASAGGQDDPSILIWDIDAKTPVCVCKKTYDRPFLATKLKFSLDHDHIFMVGGQDAVHVWKLDEETRKAKNSIIPLGKIKRTISDMEVCNGDYVFCGTRSGDIVKLYVDLLAENGSKNASIVAAAVKKAPSRSGMNAGKFTGGVTSMVMLKPDELLVGSGDGNVCVVKDQTLKPSLFKKPSHDGIPKKITEPTKPCLVEIKSKQFPGAITSLALINKRNVLIGCDNGTIYQLDTLTFDDEMISTCHTGSILDLAFPHGLDTVFSTCGVDGIRVWTDLDKNGGRQALHVPGPPHAQANCIVFTKDGKCILSGWSDGCIRCYTPQTGKLIYMIQGAHPKGVTAMALLNDGLFTGGQDGQLRTWRTSRFYPNAKPKLLSTLKEHTGSVVSLRIAQDEVEAISASADGSCIIWDISNFEKLQRRLILTATSALVRARYHPSQCQILTLATDGQVSYFEVIDGTEIRNIVLGKHSTVTSLDVSPGQGENFITSTNDSLVKVWRYKQGSLIAQGKAKSGPISKTCYSPNGDYIVAITTHGAIMIWNNNSSEI